MGHILRWEGLISSARLQEMAVDGLLNRYLLLALQHSHLYYDSLEKAKAVINVILLQFRPRGVSRLLSPWGVTVNKPRGKMAREIAWAKSVRPLLATLFFPGGFLSR